MTTMASFVLGLFCVFSSILFAETETTGPSLNQIQVKGTHNSYHLQSRIAFHATHKYTHLSLTDQLEKRGIRAVELDVHQSIGGSTSGLAVYHIGLIDGKTSCPTFKGCLSELRAWSDQHPEHVTIFVWIEIKDSHGGPKFYDFDQVDSEIREILGDRLLTPDSIQRDHPSLQAAIQSEGWPLVSEARGKFLFMLDQDDRTATVYLHGDSLEGRVMFPSANEGNFQKPWAVVAKTAPGKFHDAVMARNFLVSDNICFAGDKSADCFAKLEKSRAAGTHILMDDFEGGAKAQNNHDYFVHFTGGFKANCNSLTGSASCMSEEIDAY